MNTPTATQETDSHGDTIRTHALAYQSTAQTSCGRTVGQAWGFRSTSRKNLALFVTCAACKGDATAADLAPTVKYAGAGIYTITDCYGRIEARVTDHTASNRGFWCGCAHGRIAQNCMHIQAVKTFSGKAG